MWSQGNPSALLVGMQIGTATMENSMELTQKIKNETTVWCHNSTSGYLSGEIRYTNLKRYMHPYIHCSTIYNSQDMETT